MIPFFLDGRANGGRIGLALDTDQSGLQINNHANNAGEVRHRLRYGASAVSAGHTTYSQFKHFSPIVPFQSHQDRHHSWHVRLLRIVNTEWAAQTTLSLTDPRSTLFPTILRNPDRVTTPMYHIKLTGDKNTAGPYTPNTFDAETVSFCDFEFALAYSDDGSCPRAAVRALRERLQGTRGYVRRTDRIFIAGRYVRKQANSEINKGILSYIETTSR